MPLHSYVLVEELEDPPRASGVILTPTTSHDPIRGRVLDYGTHYIVGNQLKPIESISKDAIVVFHRAHADEVQSNGKKALIVPFQNLLGVYL